MCHAINYVMSGMYIYQTPQYTNSVTVTSHIHWFLENGIMKSDNSHQEICNLHMNKLRSISYLLNLDTDPTDGIVY
jgi:hypothetical protein